jgi:hypothetical protein
MTRGPGGPASAGRRARARPPGRLGYLAALASAVAVGLASRLVPLGVPLWDKSLGDALYAACVFSLAGTCAPRTSAGTLAGVAFLVSFAVELFQLTGIPARAPRLVAVALGTTFAWHDVLCYAAGALTAGLLASRASRGAR